MNMINYMSSDIKIMAGGFTVPPVPLPGQDNETTRPNPMPSGTIVKGSGFTMPLPPAKPVPLPPKQK